MKNLMLNLSKLNRRHFQVLLAIVYLILFVLGAGAPASGGGSGL